MVFYYSNQANETGSAANHAYDPVGVVDAIRPEGSLAGASYIPHFFNDVLPHTRIGAWGADHNSADNLATVF